MMIMILLIFMMANKKVTILQENYELCLKAKGEKYYESKKKC